MPGDRETVLTVSTILAMKKTAFSTCQFSYYHVYTRVKNLRNKFSGELLVLLILDIEVLSYYYRHILEYIDSRKEPKSCVQ